MKEAVCQDHQRYPEGKKIVERVNRKGDKEYVVRDDPNYGGSDCWIATAYYGDGTHPDVVSIRALRDTLIEMKHAGPPARFVNRIYYSTGRTRLGRWWRRGVESTSATTRKLISKIFIRSLFRLARTAIHVVY